MAITASVNASSLPRVTARASHTAPSARENPRPRRRSRSPDSWSGESHADSIWAPISAKRSLAVPWSGRASEGCPAFFLVVVDVCEHGVPGGEFGAAGVGRHGPRHRRLAERRALRHQRQTVPVVDRKESVIVEAHVAGGPVRVRHDGRAVVLVAELASLESHFVDPFGACGGRFEIEQRAVWLSVDPCAGLSERMPMESF